MLNSLYIKNFALIDELNVDFSRGLNIVTGETGAGKSIMIDAFMTVLGERASASAIRKGEKKAVIEASFDISGENSASVFIKENELEDSGENLILRREISASGNSRCFVNDSPVSVSILKNLGDLLVDFHGQHDHQLLLNPKYHLNVLDSICDFGNLKDEWHHEYSVQKSLISRLENLQNSAEESAFKLEKFTFELKEIEKINPKPDEFDKIEEKLKKSENVEEILSLCNQITGSLEHSDSSVLSQLSEVKKSLEKLISFEKEFSDYSEDFNSAVITIGEIARSVSAYRENLNFDENETESLRRRLFDLNGLRKKYGSYEAVFERLDFLKTELDNINNFDENINKLKKEIAASRSKLWKIGNEISEIRHSASTGFAGQLLKLLAKLGMVGANFKVEFSSEIVEKEDRSAAATLENRLIAAYPDGFDRAEFLISTNKGEPLKPLKDTASGGEISRIMLALKVITAEHAEMPMLVFDEIDTGISGKTARQTGLLMKQIASRHQVLAITHLPQIAALGDNNLFVSKAEDSERTRTSIKILDFEEKIRAVAQMISGDDLSRAALESARELISSEQSGSVSLFPN